MDHLEIQLSTVYLIEISPTLRYIAKVVELHNDFAMCKFGEVQQFENKDEVALNQYGSFGLTLFKDARLLNEAGTDVDL